MNERVTFLDDIDFHGFKERLGLSSNKKVELLALKLLLQLVFNLGIQKLHIFGDSLLVIERMEKEKNVHNIFLWQLYDELMVLALYFEEMSFQHLYREMNGIANTLSKEILQLTPSNWITWHQVVEIVIYFDLRPMVF